MRSKWKVASSSWSSSSSSSSSHHLPLMESNSFSLIISLELFFFFFFFFLCSSLIMTSQGRTLLSTSDSETMTAAALLAFKKSSITSDPVGFLADWSSAVAPCSWRGVFCSSDAVITSLDLSGAGLVGRIDLSHLMSLSTLAALHLAGNFFSGDFSSSSSIVPSTCSVETIDLSSNNFSETISQRCVFLNCGNLHYLNLSRNSIPGGALNFFGSSSLLHLDLSLNRISNLSLMEDVVLSSCQNLKTLNFSNNNLAGEISFHDHWSPCEDLVSLDLSNNHLTGTFPIGDMFPSLQLLDLSRNNFTGNFFTFSFGSCRNLTAINLSHNGLFGNQFPDSLTNCQLLDSLDLGYNALGPSIPGISLSSLKKLKKLYLGRNSFKGQIPPELAQTCGSLEVLDLSGNTLTGQLPSSFSSCSSLFSINLGNNQLSGDFLSTVISSLPSLRYLYLPFNNLSGFVPVSIANNSGIQVLDLSSNSLNGTIPAEFCSSLESSAALERLLLPNNYLTGKLPPELGKCNNLRTIDFSFNYLVGDIPSDIWKLPNLSDMVLWANSLTGEIPEGICNNGDNNFQTLILNNNLITGKIPLSITNCTNLMWVSLSNNRLTGEIPTGIGNLLNLAILQLGNNSLTGGIPPELGNCKSLIWLDLNSNALTGTVPGELANQSGLIVPGIVSGKHFVFVRNEGGTACRGAGGLIEFEGIRADRLDSFPMMHSCSTTRIYSGLTVYTFAHNGSMIYLDLSYNSLSGDIPDKFGSMMFLQVLNLGHNNLSGIIPFGLGKLKAVGVLDLSHNHLHGFVPPSLGGLSFLSDLDFSNNNLSGMIPSGGQLTTFPSSRYENNSGLCGVPLPPCKRPGLESGQRNSSGFHGRRNDRTVTAEMVIGIGFSIFCIVILFFALYRIKNNQKKDEKIEKYIESLQTSGSSSWKLSSVHEPLSISVSAFDQKPLIRKLTFAHLLEATNGFSADSLIGSGGFGEVYKAQLRDGTVVAIKKLIHVTGQGEREFMAEMETIGKIKHRNLVPLLGYCKIGEERLLVYEYMKWGSLESVLQDKSLDWISRKKIAIGSARGLAFLHHSCIPHIIHRDMKSSNVLLDEDFEARVSDFGMARLVNTVDTHLSVSTLAGTPGYVPPEYYQSFRCTAKGDVYSFGVVLLELLSGKRPIDPIQFGDDNNLVGWAKQLQREKKSREILDPELASDSNEEELLHYLMVAFECLEDRPYRRPTMVQVMAMFKELQVDSEGDILHGMSVKNAVIDESQEK